MISLLRAARRLSPLIALLLIPGHAQATDTSQIIPLPLNPVIPAALRDCANRTASGLGYSALAPAQGVKPTDGDYVLVNYIGYLASSGAVFDQGMQAAMPVSGVIPGFAEGMKLMPKGSTFRICVPAALGYGAEDKGPIPANSALVFQVELLDMRSAAAVEAARAGAAAPTGQ